MFYLTAFLTMLISLMIYMMDLVPNRLKLDASSAEGYVSSFINQHQAARDFMDYELGRTYTGPSTRRLDCVQTGVKQLNQNACTGASVVSLPALSFLHFIPKSYHPGSDGETTDYRYDADGRSVLFFEDKCDTSGGGADGVCGSYVSALVCVSRSDGSSLVPCFTRHTINDKGISNYDKNKECSTNQEKCRMEQNPDARIYLVTYSDGLAPEWWPPEELHTKFRRNESWHRALSTRTRGSHNCGFVTEAPAGHLWAYDNSRRHYRVRDGGETGGEYGYCIDNGRHCMRPLPLSIQRYLEQYVISTTGITTKAHYRGGTDQYSLDSIFLCLSEINGDPYSRVEKPEYFFDAIDNLARGVEARQDASSDWSWVSVADNRGPDTLDLNSRVPIGNNPTNGYGIGIGDNGQDIVMPFSFPTFQDDFTLTTILQVPIVSGSLPAGWFWGQITEGVDKIDIATQDTTTGNWKSKAITFAMRIGPGTDGGVVCSRDPQAFWVDLRFIAHDGSIGIKSVCVKQGNLLFGDGMHAWTIMKKGNNVYWIIDDTVIELKANGDVKSLGPFPEASTQKMVLSGGNGAVVGAVRYYNKALTWEQLYKNYEIDLKRYNLKNLNYSLTHDADVDVDSSTLRVKAYNERMEKNGK